jgi:CRISPR-associated protein Cmr6
MKHKGDRKPSNSPADTWKDLIQSELKTDSKIGKAFEKAGFGGLENKILTLYFEDEGLAKAAKGRIEPLKKKLPSGLLPCDRVNIQIGTVPIPSQVAVSSSKKVTSGKSTKLGNPLQALNHTEFDELPKPVLEAAVQAEKTCIPIYDNLKQRTEMLAGGAEHTFSVSFSWRLRVGGTRGFRELLLPVFHPVFGIPYIPASSLKGAARAWARHNGESDSEISEILGILKGSVAKAAKVEFLDAFPTQPCLSVDVATPQWHWQGKSVAYKPEPHPLLSMEQPQFLLGLRPTKPENAPYVAIVKEWLENSLKAGIGSRVSGGYGKALGQIATLPHSKSFAFQLWTQGLYGSEPPNKENGWKGKAEFRPTAVRGIIRYWFRAMAMSLYPPDICLNLGDSVFGKLSQQGKINISVLFNPPAQQDPYRYDGRIMLEATEQQYLDLLQQLLILASHLGGVGRGSRRSLHRLNGRMRGCHWTIDGDTLPLEYNAEQWKTMFSILKDKFKAINSTTGNYCVNPGTPQPRYQDVLDVNAQVWLVKSLGQLAPEQVKDWKQEGDRDTVRGTALTFLYSDPRFKGKNMSGLGNPLVGGSLEIPSFVWIKSIFPRNGGPYQAVTIFGVDQTDRLTFAQELEKLAKKNPSEAMLVFGQMPNQNPPRPSPPTSRPNRPIKR